LPNQAQVGDYEGFIGWISSNKLMFWGSRDADVPVRLFEYATGTYATVGTWGAPFGTILMSSTASTNYELGKVSGVTSGARFKTMAFKVGGATYKSIIDWIKVSFEPLTTGGKLDGTLTYDKAVSTQALTQILYAATDTSTTRKMLVGSPELEDFRVDLSWANATSAVKVRSLMIKGHYLENH